MFHNDSLDSLFVIAGLESTVTTTAPVNTTLNATAQYMANSGDGTDAKGGFQNWALLAIVPCVLLSFWIPVCVRLTNHTHSLLTGIMCFLHGFFV